MPTQFCSPVKCMQVQNIVWNESYASYPSMHELASNSCEFLSSSFQSMTPKKMQQMDPHPFLRVLLPDASSCELICVVFLAASEHVSSAWIASWCFSCACFFSVFWGANQLSQLAR